MKCKVARKLAAYEVGLLSAPERALVEQHLGDCAVCRAELAAVRATADLLQPMPRADAPRDTWQHVQARLTPRHRRSAAPARRWVPVLAAAMLILILATAFLVPIGGGLPVSQDSYAGVQLAADWESPLADKAALGLALLAVSQSPGEEVRF